MKQRLSYSNVMATLALFVALGGTSYAAATITGADVRNGSLTGKDVKNRSLTGVDIKNRSLTGSDVKDGAQCLLQIVRWGALRAPQPTGSHRRQRPLPRGRAA